MASTEATAATSAQLLPEPHKGLDNHPDARTPPDAATEASHRSLADATPPLTERDRQTEQAQIDGSRLVSQGTLPGLHVVGADGQPAPHPSTFARTAHCLSGALDVATEVAKGAGHAIVKDLGHWSDYVAPAAEGLAGVALVAGAVILAPEIGAGAVIVAGVAELTGTVLVADQIVSAAEKIVGAAENGLKAVVDSKTALQTMINPDQHTPAEIASARQAIQEKGGRALADGLEAGASAVLARVGMRGVDAAKAAKAPGNTLVGAENAGVAKIENGHLTAENGSVVPEAGVGKPRDFRLGANEYNLPENSRLVIGKETFGDASPSGTAAKQTVIGRDDQGIYVQDAGGENSSGTWIKRSDQERFERVAEGVTLRVQPGDVVRIGGEQGVTLSLRDPDAFKLPKPGSETRADLELFAQRTALKTGEIPLASETAVADAAREARQMTGGWHDDLNAARQERAAAAKTVRDTQSDYDRAIYDAVHPYVRKPGDDPMLDDIFGRPEPGSATALPNADYHDPAVARELLKDRPNLLDQADKYFASLSEQDRVLRETPNPEGALAQRKQEMTKFLEEQAKANGLPPPKVDFVPADKMGAAAGKYRFGKGTVIVNEDALSGSFADDKGAGFMGTQYHELTHHEQTVTVLKYIADQVGVKGDVANPEQMEEMKKLFGRDVDDDFVKEVLKSRAPQGEAIPLTDEQTARARNLLESKQNNHLVDSHQLFADHKIVEKAASDLSQSHRPDWFVLNTLENLAKDNSGEIARKLFGSTAVPPELQSSLQAIKDSTITQQQVEETIPVLQRLLNKRLQEINSEYEQSVNQYLQLHEREAFYTGNRLGQQMQTPNPH